MKKNEQNECFGISSNLFPCVNVDMYWGILDPQTAENNMEDSCDEFEYFSIDMGLYKNAVASLASDYIGENVLPMMKEYGLENITDCKISSPREYNFTTDCLLFTAEMSHDWREKMHHYLNKFRKDKKFQEYIEEHWYSRSGFWSWMPQSFEEIEEMADEERCVGAYLTLCLLNEGRLDVFTDSEEYIYYGLEECSLGDFYNVPEEYLGRIEGEKLIALYRDDYRINELWHDLLDKVGQPWKGCEQLYGKYEPSYCISAKNDAMRLIFWACENGYTVSDLEAMAA